MRVLLTGATGFIGRAVAHALRQRGHAVVRASRRPAASDPDVVQADFASGIGIMHDVNPLAAECLCQIPCKEVIC